jgi:hypothetical protein
MIKLTLEQSGFSVTVTEDNFDKAINKLEVLFYANYTEDCEKVGPGSVQPVKKYRTM